MSTEKQQLDSALESDESSAPSLSFENPLEDLFTEAMLQKKIRVKRSTDPSDRHALDAAAKKMREMYTLPENWERSAGIALIDKGTNTLVGNFSEYRHKTFAGTRKLLREHAPISIDRTEYVDGYLGERLEQKLRGMGWEQEHAAVVHVLLDELMVEAPLVKVNIRTRLGALVRADLLEDTQFASVSGEKILSLPVGTNILEVVGVDTKAAMRRAVS